MFTASQARRRALAVIRLMHRADVSLGIGAASRHRRHRHAVFEMQGTVVFQTEVERFKQLHLELRVGRP